MSFRQKICDALRLLAIGLIAGAVTMVLDQSIHGVFQSIYGALTALTLPQFALGAGVALLAGSLVAGFLTHQVAPEAKGSGVPQMKSAYLAKDPRISFRGLLTKFIACVIGIGSGLSLGRRGPSAFIGAAVGSNIAEATGAAPQFRKTAFAAGSAAGLAAAFNTPLAAITFFLEEVLNEWNAQRIAHLFVATAPAILLFGWLHGPDPIFQLDLDSKLSLATLLLLTPTALAASALGCWLQGTILFLGRRFARADGSYHWMTPMIGAAAVWAIGTLAYAATKDTAAFGLGDAPLNRLISGAVPVSLAMVWIAARFFGVAIAFGSGGCGGVFTPLLFLGGAIGFSVGATGEEWGIASRSDTQALIAIGMCACIGAVVQAPLTATLMMFEMTHSFALLPALMGATLISQTVGRRLCGLSIYDALLSNHSRIAPPEHG